MDECSPSADMGAPLQMLVLLKKPLSKNNRTIGGERTQIEIVEKYEKKKRREYDYSFLIKRIFLKL